MIFAGKYASYWGNIYREVLVRTEEGPLLLKARVLTKKQKGGLPRPFIGRTLEVTIYFSYLSQYLEHSIKIHPRNAE